MDLNYKEGDDLITVNDKIKLFTKRILDIQEKEYKTKANILESQIANDYEISKDALIKSRDKYKSFLLKDLKAEKIQRLSNARSEKKRRILLRKKNMIDTLLKGVKEYSKEFVNSSSYDEYLLSEIKKNIDTIKSMGDIDVFLSEKDILKKEMIIKIFEESNVKITSDSFSVYEANIIGGIIFIRKDKTSKLDMSINSVIENNKEYMGQVIYKMLEKSGEVNDK